MLRLLTVVAALSLPVTGHAQLGLELTEPLAEEPEDPGVYERPDPWFALAGTGAFAGNYVSNLFLGGLFAGIDLGGTGATVAQWDDFRLFSLVPVAGPWMQLAAKPTAFEADFWGAYLIFMGLAQLTGVVFYIVSLARPAQFRVRPPDPPNVVRF